MLYPLMSRALTGFSLMTFAIACSDQVVVAGNCDHLDVADDSAAGDVAAGGSDAADASADIALACTTTCDDGNVCTTDSCVGGACQHAVVVCGNGKACMPNLQGDPDLLGFWPFDDCEARDLSANHLNGVLVGQPKCIDGAVGKGLHLDGATQWVQVPNALALDVTRTSLSFGGWFASENTGEYTVGINKEGSFELGRISGQLASAFATGPDFDWFWKPAGVASEQDWHHLAVVYDGQAVTHYVDGVAAPSYPLTGGVGTHKGYTWNCDLAIGARGLNCGGAAQFWHGSVDDAWVFSRALTAEEVKRMAQKAPNTWQGGCAP